MPSPEYKIRRDAAKARVRLVQEILRRWDPIGVEPGTMAPADEYDSYAPHIVSLVQGGCSVEDLAAHLDDLSTTTIGVVSNPKASASFAAQILEVLGPTKNALERTRGE